MSTFALQSGAPALDPDQSERQLPIYLKHVLVFATLVGLWELGARAGWIDALLFPAPSSIAESIWRIYVTQGNVWYHLYVTYQEAILGCAAGILLGVGLAAAAALSETFRNYIKPYIVIIEATPRIAVGPLLVAWLGFGLESKVALAALVCFFAPFVNTLTGLLDVDREAEELFRSLGASKWQIFWKLRVPSAATIIMAGFKLAVTGAFTGALVAEFISANEGLSVMMYRYTSALNMAGAFATLLSITFFAFMLYKLAEFVDYRMLYWRSAELMKATSRKRQRAFMNSLRTKTTGGDDVDGVR